jgi:response regulator RpfG family c-di-GMP phosphodiesterase
VKGELMNEPRVLLMVDDEPDILDFLTRVFRKQYTLLRAESADAAVAVLAEQPVDLIISDHRMPGKNGLQLLGEVRERFPSTTRVLLSGFSDLPEITEAAASGLVHAYVVKPVDSQRLREAVAEAEARAGLGEWVRGE